MKYRLKIFKSVIMPKYLMPYVFSRDPLRVSWLGYDFGWVKKHL